MSADAPDLQQIALDPSFWRDTGLWITTAIIAAVARLVWSGLGWALQTARWHAAHKNKVLNLNISGDGAGELAPLDFFCLVVRYGTDDYMRHMASDSEKFAGRLQNRAIRITKSSQHNGTLSLRIKVPVHKRLGTQFKCFVNVPKGSDTSRLSRAVSSQHKFSNSDLSETLEGSRMYFLLKAYPVVKTVEGIENNHLYPV
jgi:hypothetical protein